MGGRAGPGGGGFVRNRLGVKALFFDGEDRITLMGMTSCGAFFTTMEGTGITVQVDSYSVTAASSEGKIAGVYVTAGETVTEG